MKKITPQELAVYLRKLQNGESIWLNVRNPKQYKLGKIILTRNTRAEYPSCDYMSFDLVDRSSLEGLYDDIRLYSQDVFYSGYDIYIQKVVIV